MTMLFKLTAKNLLQRPLRYALTSFAIVFSVAAVAAVFIFTGGLRTTFDELATNIEAGYDIAVQPDIAFGDGFLTPTVPLENRELLEGIDGVAEVSPRVVGAGVIPVDGDDVPTVAGGGPNLGIAWGDDAGSAARYFTQSGRRPSSPDEFALDIDAFAEGAYELGERYVLQVPTAEISGQTFELTGTFTFGDPDRNALVGARIVAFDLEPAVELLNAGQGFSDITLILDEDADIDEVIGRIDPIVGDDLNVLSQEAVIERTQGNFGQILGIFQTVLLVFAVIILFVSSFLIYNVFSITLGQRIRELGLLRAVGALGSQITTLMIGEALLLGIVGTIVGLPAGVGLAWLLRAALSALGFPDDTGLPVNIWTIVWAIFTGVVVTVLAAIWPSIQARRVAPIAALRDGANLNDLTDTRNVSLGTTFVIGGIAATVLTFVFGGWIPRFFLPVLGALLLFAGVLLIVRSASRLVLFPYGVAMLIIVLVGDFELGETFALLGSGALIALLGANQLNPFIAAPVTGALGRLPTAILLGLVGLGLGLASVAALVGAGIVAASGTPDFIIDAAESDVPRLGLIIPLLIGGAILSVLSYAMIRTALGARGLTGRLARSNAARNPQRTATTAAALMIGLTLVTAVTVIGDSIKASVSDALSSSITADWLLRGPQGGPGGTPFSTEVADRVEALDEVESVLRFRVAFPAAWVTSESGELTAADFQEFLPIVLELLDDDADLSPQRLLELREQIGTDVEINDAAAVDFATLDDHIDPDFIERDLSLLGPNAIYIEQSVAEERGLEVGDTFSALFVDLQSEDLVVAGIYDNGFVLGNRVMSLDLWNEHFPNDSDQFLTVITSSGVPPQDARTAIENELGTDFPIIEVQTREEFAEANERQINQTLATVNVLLGLSGVIAALGILVALALSVFERTREIGLFRAVGATRQQTRWIIRWEGVMIAAFGGFIGVVLGVALGILATNKLPEFLVTQTSVPILTLAIYVLFAAIVGLFAAVFPAWTAGRMNVLEAISTE